MNDCFLHIESHMRAMMIEQIMARIGRASPNPKSYRRTLESYETKTLQSLHSKIFPQPNIAAVDPGRSAAENEARTVGAALEQYDTHSLDARGKTQVGKTPVREFNLQPALNQLPE